MSSASPPSTHTSAKATIAGLALEAQGDGNALRFREGTQWREVSYPELTSTVTDLARGLIALGVEPGDRVAILSATRPEWTQADLAILAAGAVTVPIYQTNSPEECQYVLEDSGAVAVLCEDGDQLAKIARIREQCPQLRSLVAFTEAGEEALSLEQLVARGADVDADQVRRRAAAVTPDDLATIVYTSGTTGSPKGCMLTHGNMRANLDMVRERVPLDGHEVFYVFLPLAHVLTRIVQLLALDAGAELAYWQRDPKRIVDEIGEVQPTHLPSVPRVFEKIHTTANARVAAAGGVKAKLFGWAFGVGRAVREAERAGRRPSPLLTAQHRLADRLVLGKVRALFGGRIELCLTGAAPIEPEVMSFFHAAGVWVLEGYGMTETTAVATVNTIEEHKLGTVGRPLPGCEVRIADDGEVLMRGPNIFTGYWRKPEATQEDLVDGWLHSGDLGEIDDDGFLRIVGRKKDIIITSSGKNVAPSAIENAIRGHRWISQAVVYGDRRPYLTALITLDPDEAPALAEHVGAPSADLEALAGDERVRAELRTVIDEANQRFARIEQVKDFVILPRDLSQDHDELTPTLKVRRAVVHQQHGERLEALYR